MKSWLATVEQSRWAALIPMALAAVLGIATIGSKSMWLDEAFSAAMIKLPTIDLLRYTVHHEFQASPYYFVLQLWSVVGHDETALRLLSVIFGVLGVLATYALGRRFGVGFAAALLLAVSPFFVHYEQEVRVYTLLVAWSAIATLAYLRLVERPSRWRAAAYVVAAAGLIYIHPLNGWMLVAHALVTLVYVPVQWRWRLLALYVPVLIAAIPIARFLILNRARADWIPGPTPYFVSQQLSQLMGAAALAIALALVIAFGLGRAWRRELPALRLPLLLLTLTIGGILVMSLFVQPLFVDRYLIGVLPMLFIIVARAAASLPWPRAVMAGLLVLSVTSSVSWLIDGVKDNWRAAAAYVDAHVQPGDGVIIWPNYYRMPFAYYSSAGEPLYPSAPWSEVYLPLWEMNISLPPDVDNERIWLVRTSPFVSAPEVAALLDNYDTIETRVFGTARPEVVLLVRR